VLVTVKAASINPGEAKTREGLFHAYFPATFPSGEGTDLAGIVTKVGPGVVGFAAGDEVGFAAGDEVIGFTDRRGHTLGKIVLLP
jgi:NADPH:quinone reductase-like Zn-dependent oxidoreductase